MALVQAFSLRHMQETASPCRDLAHSEVQFLSQRLVHISLAQVFKSKGEIKSHAGLWLYLSIMTTQTIIISALGK